MSEIERTHEMLDAFRIDRIGGDTRRLPAAMRVSILASRLTAEIDSLKLEVKRLQENLAKQAEGYRTSTKRSLVDKLNDVMTDVRVLERRLLECEMGAKK